MENMDISNKNETLTTNNLMYGDVDEQKTSVNQDVVKELDQRTDIDPDLRESEICEDAEKGADSDSIHAEINLQDTTKNNKPNESVNKDSDDKLDEDNKPNESLNKAFDDKLNEDNKTNEPLKKDSDEKLDETNLKNKEEKTNDKEDDDFIDILGNGLLTKKTLKKGLGRETRPSHGDKVTIEYDAYNSQDYLFESETTSFIVGDGDMIQAFDLGICLAEKLEEFELKTDARFAYGVHGNLPDIQPNESLKFRIKLLLVDDAPDLSTYEYQDRLIEVDKKRERGNYFYRREDYSLAVNSYSKALKLINTDPQFKSIASDSKKEELYELFVKVTNNLAAAQLKLESYDSVIETCNSILEYQPDNVKALFRKGKSLSNKGNYEEAIAVLKYALSLETNSKLISNELMRCTTLKKQENEQRARICRKMFGTGNNLETSSKDDMSTFTKLKKMTISYSPYVAAVIVTGISITFAYLSISKAK